MDKLGSLLKIFWFPIKKQLKHSSVRSDTSMFDVTSNYIGGEQEYVMAIFFGYCPLPCLSFPNFQNYYYYY
jgi:hypothetical protein